ncbi:MAG: stage II sporulation protein M [Candidatus Thorarchaeota archaeon]|nr:stage II sporulation protein M [Candidatus Thorarchaeota archaeon]
MAISELTILTIVFEFLPPLIVTFIYLLFFGKRKSKLIESFIILMYVKTITWFLLDIVRLPISVSSGFDPIVSTSGLSWILLTDMLFQFFSSLQEYLLWIMMAFLAVLFGMLVLAAKLTLQDPLKMKFKNIIKRIVGKEPESDGYAGLTDRLNNIKFEGLETNPLDPEVQAKAWRQAWKDYVIIGLATLVPSITIYVGSLESFIVQKTDMTRYLADYAPDNYYLGVIIFLTWIYRFGYPASNRIAKAVGLHLGNRDIGSEMMRGVLGWFFRLNILLTLYTFASQAIDFFASDYSDPIGLLTEYYGLGLLLAAPPIIFAVIVLPYAEDFSSVFYKRTFDALAGARTKIRESNKSAALRNVLSGIGTGIAVTGAFAGAVFASTLSYAQQSFSAYGLFNDNPFRLFPRDVDDVVAHILELVTTPTSLYPSAFIPRDNYSLISPTLWAMLMLGIPFASMILIGILGHYIRGNSKGGSESFAIFAGSTVATITYIIFQGMDYILGVSVTPATYAGEVFYRLRPVPFLPEADQWLWRLASQFAVNLPTFIFTALFILYFFEFRKRWKETTGDVSGPLLNVKRNDVLDSVIMFFGGLVVSIIGVWILAEILQNPAFFNNLLNGLLQKIGAPDGLEGILPPPTDPLTLGDPGGWFIVFAEHNIVRILLMLIIGPVFWAAVLWFVGAKKTKSESNMGLASVVSLVCLGAATVLLTQFNANTGMFIQYDPFNPRWGFTTQLGQWSLIIFGIPVLVLLGIIAIRYWGGKGIGAWWFPVFIFIFAIEYFVYDDQFTLIALIVLPAIIAGAYRLMHSKREDVRSEDFIITYIRFSLMAVAIAEVLSTALTVGGIAIINLTFGGNAWQFLASIIPHAIVEIPVFLLAAGLSIRIARDLGPTVKSEDWNTFPAQTRDLLSDERTWRTVAMIAFLLIVAAIIEAYVTPIVWQFALLFF